MEKGRLPASALAWVRTEVADASSAFALAPLTVEVADALGEVARAAVPDMPDRIIAATARALGLPLVSADGKIGRAPGLTVIW